MYKELKKSLVIFLSVVLALSLGIATLFAVPKAKGDETMTITGLVTDENETSTAFGNCFKTRILTSYPNGSQLNNIVLGMNKIFINGVDVNEKCVQPDWWNDYGEHIGILGIASTRLTDGTVVTFNKGLKFNEWTDPGLANDQTFKYDAKTNTWSEYVKSELILSDVEIVNSNGASQDVSFVYEGNGGFITNKIPCEGDIYMSFTANNVSHNAVIGQVFGFGRATGLGTENQYFEYTENASVAFRYNGGTDTETPNGEIVVYKYSVQDHKVYKNGVEYTPGNYLFDDKTFEYSDSKGGKYFALTFGGSYSATLANFKCYDSEGNDLGINLSKTCLESSSVSYYGEEGEVVTVKPTIANSKIVLSDSDNGAIDVAVTDNQNGTYSFTMPNYAVKVKSVRPVLTLDNVETTKINGVSQDVTFVYEGNGGFITNKIPCEGDIYMSFTAKDVSRSSIIGQVFGFGRATGLGTESQYFTYTENASVAFRYNGGTNTETPEGEETVYRYSVQDHKVYKNGVEYTPGNYLYDDKTFEYSDSKGGKYFALTFGGNYSATLTNFKCYDSEGNDLGINLAKTCLKSSSSTLYGEAGKVVTVKPTFANSSFVFYNEKNEVVDVALTDNLNGTYSFIMPDYSIKVSTLRPTLKLIGAETTKINGVSQDVTFVYEGNGGFITNKIPCEGDIYMSFIAKDVSRSAIIGQVFGFGRSSDLGMENQYFNFTENASVAFRYNGGTSTETPEGEEIVYRYSVQDHKVYKNGVEYTPGNYLDDNKTFEYSDSKGGKYFALTFGGNYSATLTNFKCYDSEGNDLGVNLSQTCVKSYSVDCFGERGKTITVKPNYALGVEFEVLNGNGDVVDIEVKNNQDGTYSFIMPDYSVSVEAKIAINDTTKLINVTSERSYGLMSQSNKTRFSLHFGKLGILNGYEKGADITNVLNTRSFMDNVLVNGVSLTEINKVKLQGITVYKYAKGEANYNGVNYFGADDAIEIIIPSAQIFDYDVTVKEGCVLGDVKIEETATYHLNPDEKFDKVETVDSKVKPIAIREIPYANVEERFVRIVFNNSVNYDSSLNGGKDLIDFVSFSGFDKSYITGGKYFHSEVELANRSYCFYADSEKWVDFVLSENATITVDSFKLTSETSTEKVVFTMKWGTFVPDFDTNVYEEATITQINHPGNQENDKKLFSFDTNYSFNYYLAPSFLLDNIYVNGQHINKNYSAGYCNSEDVYNTAKFSVYIDDNLRNYDGGVDIIYIKAGTPLSAGRYITKDVYFYNVQNRNERDGAYNWIWTASNVIPDLKLLQKEEVSSNGSSYTLKVYFDRAVAIDSELFGVYNEVDIKDYLLINGKTLTELGTDASYAWGENFITLTVNKSALGNSDIISVKFANGFTAPLGFAFSDETETVRFYSIQENVWTNGFDKIDVFGFAENSLESISGIKTVNCGTDGIKYAKRITVKFKYDIVGKTLLDVGYGRDPYISYVKVYRNVTAPLADLVKMTELGFNGNENYAGYNYTDVIIDRIVGLDLKNAIIDNVSINGVSLRDILKNETAYVAYVNYPVSVDLIDNEIILTIQQDSKIYDQIGDGMTLAISEGLIFENENRITTEYGYKYVNGQFVAETTIKGIVVTTNKTQYYKGEDLILSRFIAYCVNNDGTRGDSFEVTADMISGYDKNSVGEQEITITYLNKSTKIKINVIDDGTSGDEPGTSQGGGCLSTVTASGTVTLITLSLCAALLIIKAKKKDNE